MKDNIIPQTDQPVFLILRVTSRCNFACSYCATHNDKHKDMTPEQAIEFISKYNKIAQIQFEGGEPTMVGVDWYKTVLDYIDKHYPDAILSMTTNLWNFYNDPKKWTPILSHLDGVCTSFDDTKDRKVANGTVIDRELFKKMVDTYHQYIPKESKTDPNLAVLTLMNDENLERWNDIIDFLQIECKLDVKFNAIREVGRSLYHTPKIEMLKLWRNILRNGYMESHCDMLYEHIINKIPFSGCPFDINCDKKFIIITVDGPVATCSHYYDATNDVTKLEKPVNIEQSPRRKVIFPDKCFTCKCFFICNGCRIDSKQILKDYPTEQERQEYCEEVQKIYQEIESYVRDRNNFLNSNKFLQ